MTTQLSPERPAVTPLLELDLIDAERAVGWILGDRVGFRGFADAVEAAHAAWVAHRTLARRLARLHGTRPVPIDSEPLAVERRGGAEVILASGRVIAALLRPGTESPSGQDSFGFEIRVPQPADEQGVRAAAHLMYRTLRKSGLRWALWRPAAVRAPVARADVDRENESTIIVNGDESAASARVRQRPRGLLARPWRRARRVALQARARSAAGAPRATEPCDT